MEFDMEAFAFEKANGGRCVLTPVLFRFTSCLRLRRIDSRLFSR